MNKIPQVVLLLNAVLHLYFGLVFVINPEPLMQSLSISALSPTGLVEMRTFYGGLMSAIGFFFLYGAFSSQVQKSALIFAVITYGAAIIVRSWGMATEGLLNSEILRRIWIIEFVGFLLSVATLVFSKRKEKNDECEKSL